MPDLQFSIKDVKPAPNAVSPQLNFRTRIQNTTGEAVQSIALRAQVQIEPVRRRYSPDEQARLRELFGEPERWSQTLRPLLWANVSLNIPSFSGETVVDLLVPCTFDFNVAMTKYVYGLTDGELPTSVMFSGTAFFAGGMGLQIWQIPWDREASYKVPVPTWKQMMDSFYGDSAWIALRRDVFDRLQDYKARNAIHSWEALFESILGCAAGGKP